MSILDAFDDDSILMIKMLKMHILETQVVLVNALQISLQFSKTRRKLIELFRDENILRNIFCLTGS